MSIVRTAARVALWALIVAACAEATPDAKPSTGVCFRLTGDEDAEPTRRAIARGIVNLETCAARLEVFRQRENASIRGEYQNHYLFVDADNMQASRTLDGPRFRILEDADRIELQQAVARRLEVEARPPRSGPPVVPGGELPPLTNPDQ